MVRTRQDSAAELLAREAEPSAAPAPWRPDGEGAPEGVRFGILSRMPRRILAARTVEELRDVLAFVVDGLYPLVGQFELFLSDDGRELEPVATRDDLRRRRSRQLLGGLRSRVLQRGGRLAERQALPAIPHLRRGAMMSAPVLDADDLVGLVAVERVPEGPEFRALELDVLEGIAAQLALALRSLRTHRADRQRARIEQDRKAAHRIQRGLMTCSLPPGLGVRARAGYLPALDVGGDFYTVSHLGGDRVGAAIGDVAGNGVSAALVMSRVALDVQRALAGGSPPAEVLRGVNERMLDGDGETFATAACAWLDARSRVLTVANAGHLPILVRRTSGEVEVVGGATGTPLGMLPETYAEERIQLRPGDLVLLVTDGLAEALEWGDGAVALGRLPDLVRRAPHDVDKLSRRIHAAVKRSGSHQVLDDVAWIALQLDA